MLSLVDHHAIMAQNKSVLWYTSLKVFDLK